MTSALTVCPCAYGEQEKENMQEKGTMQLDESCQEGLESMDHKKSAVLGPCIWCLGFTPTTGAVTALFGHDAERGISQDTLPQFWDTAPILLEKCHGFQPADPKETPNQGQKNSAQTRQVDPNIIARVSG